MSAPHSSPIVAVLTLAGIAGLDLAAETQIRSNPSIESQRSRQLSEDDAIFHYLWLQGTNLIKVTDQPVMVLNPRDIVSCQPPWMIQSTPHGTYWIQVLVNPDPKTVEIIKTGKGVYPEGTIILKQKFLDAEAKQTEFYTGMRKREKDYHPEFGDWEFFTLDETGTKVTARGKIDSCMDCHANFKQTDFVSRKYLKEPPTKPAAQPDK